MLNKFILFSLLALMVPVFVYVGIMQVRDFFSVVIPPVGIVANRDDLAIVQTTRSSTSKPMVFVGDVLLARNVEHLLETKFFFNPLLNAKDFFGGAPVVIGNFESAILENHVKTPSYVTTFSVAKKFLPLLTEAGFTHVSLANNHSFDYGASTFTYTVNSLLESNLIPVGLPNQISTSSIAIIPTGDYTVGLIAINEIFTQMDTKAIIEKINQLKEKTDFQIAYVHWGEEYKLKHNQNQEALAYKLIDAGIDAVIGHHPHVTQDIEVYKDKAIFYSLGNFLFDQYFSVDVQQGITVSLLISSSTVTYTIKPVSSEGTLSQPHAMEATDSVLFLKNLSRRSNSLYAQNIALGKLILPFNLATSTDTSMITP